jgi:hypothetical protein
MEIKINEINNMEGLKNLKVNSGVDLIHVLRGENRLNIYEGIKLINDFPVHSFLSFDKTYPQDRLIKSYKVKEEDISFKPHFNGSIKIRSHDHETYSPGEKIHGEKSDLIWKIIQGGIN